MRIVRVIEGKQAHLLGVKPGDTITHVKNLEVTEHNKSEIRKVLATGGKCIVSFRRPPPPAAAMTVSAEMLSWQDVPLDSTAKFEIDAIYRFRDLPNKVAWRYPTYVDENTISYLGFGGSAVNQIHHKEIKASSKDRFSNFYPNSSNTRDTVQIQKAVFRQPFETAAGSLS